MWDNGFLCLGKSLSFAGPPMAGAQSMRGNLARFQVDRLIPPLQGGVALEGQSPDSVRVNYWISRGLTFTLLEPLLY